MSAVIPNCNGVTETYFQGIYKTVKTCSSCNNSCLTFNHFFHIKIVPKDNTTLAIAEALKDYCFDSQCSHCNSVCKHFISCTIYDHPRVLFLLIDRYTQSSSYARARRDLGRIFVEHDINLFGNKYELSGIVLHLGTTVNSGHYIAYIKRDGYWFICNDTNVQSVKSLPDPSGEAYLLFYTKHNGALL